MAALALTDKISQQSQLSTKFRTRVIKFGDGYEQRVRDGLNTQEDSWSLTWDSLTSAETTTLINLFVAQGGTATIEWTPPGEGAEKKFVVETYSKQALAGSVYSVSATLRQVYDY